MEATREAGATPLPHARAGSVETDHGTGTGMTLIIPMITPPATGDEEEEIEVTPPMMIVHVDIHLVNPEGLKHLATEAPATVQDQNPVPLTPIATKGDQELPRPAGTRRRIRRKGEREVALETAEMTNLQSQLQMSWWGRLVRLAPFVPWGKR